MRLSDVVIPCLYSMNIRYGVYQTLCPSVNVFYWLERNLKTFTRHSTDDHQEHLGASSVYRARQGNNTINYVAKDKGERSNLPQISSGLLKGVQKAPNMAKAARSLSNSSDAAPESHHLCPVPDT